MKPKPNPVTSRLFTIAFSVSTTLAPAAPLTWDANGTTTGQTNGGGNWLGTGLWWNGTANQDWISGSDAILGGPATAGGTLNVASNTSVQSLTFNPFTGTYTMGTSGTVLTLDGGLTMNAGSGIVGLTASSVTLGGPQNWTNNSTNALNAKSGVTNGGHTLTIAGSGPVNFDATASIISGTGGLTKTGSGRLVLGGGGTIPAHSYSGTTTLSGGVTMVSNNNIGGGNLTLNGGVMESYWSSNFTRSQGTGNGQVQITGGESGFSCNGATGLSVIFGNNAGLAANDAIWGSATFNPGALVLQAASAQAGSSLTFANKLDLNGTNRTIRSNATALGVSSTISGVIRNSDTVNAAGLIKTGPGLIILTGANTYNGGTTISQGNLRFAAINTMPATGDVAVQDGATLTIEAGAAGDWTAATSGIGSIGGLLAGLGGQAESTVSFTGNVTLGLETTANLTYPAIIGNLGTSLAVAKSGGSSLTLSANNSYLGKTSVLGGTLSFNSIANVGSGDSALGAPTTAATGTIDIGYRTTSGTLTYTGSGHTSNRIINLTGTTGAATLDASGSAPLVLTSSITATGGGAKTLTLTGANTANNSLAPSSIPGLADILTIQKSGAGTWWINGFSSPKNAWSVTAGTLVLAGAITTGDQQITVSGGTLAGVGPITLQSGKTLTIQAAGSLAPGNLTVGTLALTGNLSVSAMAAGTGKLNFQIGAPAASDKITVTGSAQIGTGVLGFSDFTFTDMGGVIPGTYVLISTTTGITGTLDPANRSGMIGSLNGTLQINGNNLEWSTDQDLDGIPDVYELANTTPPSATAFHPGDDLDTDGSANLQEYLAGTNPNLADTDGDSFDDGVENNTGTWLSASNTGTNPLLFDTDGDTTRDGHERNTGIHVSATDPGTNPNKPDSDSDGCRDNVETNTGTFISKTNTGTDPNDSDTDNDGAGDWYEVTASFTSPFLASEKPNIPYPLPDPDGSTGTPNKPVKVYIMSGQSNMVGFGTVTGSDTNALTTMTRAENKFPNLIDSAGNFIARQDVRYRGVISAIGNAPLAPGFGANSNTFGPELGFGQVMGWLHDEPVLLIKSSIGNRSLGWDILPHGSPSYVYGSTNYAGFGGWGNWAVGASPPTSGPWYAGKEFDRFFKHESEWAHPDVAATNVVDVLDNFASQYPGFASQGFEIAGFVWWQGDKDRYDLGHATRYEHNLVNLITSLRSYYTNRYPGKVVNNAPFVLATLGQTPLNSTDPAEKPMLDGMLAVDGESGEYPQFAGNVKTVYAHPLSEGGASNGHYNGRAGTYMLVGDALGRAMVSLQSSSGGNTFATWIAGFPSVPPGLAGFDQDADGDGIENGAENFFGTNPGVGSPGLVASASSGNTFTFTHPQNATPATGVTAAYRWSKDLTTFRNHGQTDGENTTVSFNAVANAGVTTVTATVTGTATTKLFVDAKVTHN